MKIYVYDRYVYGASVTVANTAEEALTIFKNNQIRDCENIKVDDLDEYLTDQPALILDNLGDT